MADRMWTAEQQQVIDSRGSNLLVSAAAGSGKTAVLVERIIRMVTDEKDPVDIDRLLVMTFTNAAAAEMRERIGDALEARLLERPGDANLERQTTLIHNAKITTIDSFCLRLLREHFNELDIDPGFRIAEEGELLLLQADVLKNVLEDYYSRGDERFLRFVDAYASGKADGGLDDYILQVWRFSQSNPWPKEWIDACKREVTPENPDVKDARAENTVSALEKLEKSDSPWMRFLLADVRVQAEEFAGQLEEAIAIAGDEDGPQAYLPMLQADLESMERLSCATEYGEVWECLSAPLFGRLAAVRGKNVNPEKKELAAAIRNRVKDGMKKMKALYLPGDLSEVFQDLLASGEPVLVLLELAEAFTEAFQAAKREKNLVDFNDLEHFALKILTGGSLNHQPGPVADALAQVYREILVDEYQDSNEVQETLIYCISRERFGEPNVFMVGDVKQSIYKFRLAKPELFLKKYEEYGTEPGSFRKIELHKNFRSRPEVLESVNDLFYGIMTKALGNIGYTAEAALNPGASYPPTQKEHEARTELFLLNTGEELLSGMEEDALDYTAKEAEARLIAARIKELTCPETGMKIWNGKTNAYEPLRLGDIVILLRSLSGWAEEFLSVLGAEGIPAYSESRTGYFSAVEVETVLAMLALIDNPMQDIPMAAVLRSPIGGLTNRELAILMGIFKKNAVKDQDRGIYGAVKNYLNGQDPRGQEQNATELYRKLHRFQKILNTLREEAEYLPVHRLIYRIYELTGYYAYAAAMPAGKIRQANLDMLVQKAASYEKTSYQSLFDFIRYIEKLKKYNTDFGEASDAADKGDVVRIMSIHKSKGLEFPVVFLAGAGKQFNRQDVRGKILIDEALGIATDYMDAELKIKAPTLKKNVLSRRMNLESMGEELRILYVAMTRAREKLIITAGDRYLENRLEKWGPLSLETGKGGLPFTYLSAASSYLDWLLMAAGHTKESIRIQRVPMEELLRTETVHQAEKAGLYARLKEIREQDGTEMYPYILSPYAYEADLTLHAKMSVSELKERGQFVDDGQSDFLPTIPRFMREENQAEQTDGTDEPACKKAPALKGEGQNTLSATFRGTAYHRALELLPFAEIKSRADIRRHLERLRTDEKMDEAAIALLSEYVLDRFFKSGLAARMQEADRRGGLHKEGQFVMGIPAREMDEADSDELVLIQGIIDAWFEEPDGLVLVDYKTDRIPEGGEEILRDRYALQMIYYARALSQMTGKPVKEMILYSLSLLKEVEFPKSLAAAAGILYNEREQTAPVSKPASKGREQK